ncbi:MAG: glycoside hydrolase family 28 protein [Bacteroidota bacterium]
MKLKLSSVAILFWVVSLSLNAQENGIYNVVDFGAIGDGNTLNTEAIQQAIDVCMDNGGGKVIVPPGDYLSGPLLMKSNLTFEVFPGAKLIFSDDIENNPIIDGRWEGIERKVYASLFTGHDLENITITGRGTIDGQGEKWWLASEETKRIRKQNGIREREPNNPPGSPLKVPRPRLVNLYNCTNVLISELKFINSPAWTIHPVYCQNVNIDKISIIQPYESPNTDGINPESCKDVRITNCFVDVGDDCITLKSGYNEDGRRVGRACEDIVISNCTFAHGRSAIGIGSEMSGDVRNVAVSNCVFNGTLRGIRVKSGRGRGGVVENLRVNNIIMTNVRDAISIDMYYGKKDTGTYEVTVETPFFHNIHLNNISAINVTNAANVFGLPEAPVTSFSISNSNFEAQNGFDIQHVKDLTLRNVTVKNEKMESLKVDFVDKARIDNFNGIPLEKTRPAIHMTKSSDLLIYHCKPSPDLKTFIHAEDCDDLDLDYNWLDMNQILIEEGTP